MGFNSGFKGLNLSKALASLRQINLGLFFLYRIRWTEQNYRRGK